MVNRISQYLEAAKSEPNELTDFELVPEGTPNFKPAEWDHAVMAIVWRDGKPEVYALRSKSALDELIAHLGTGDEEGDVRAMIQFPDVVSVKLS